MKKNKPYNIEFEIIPYDSNQKRTINSVAELIRDTEGNPLKVMGVLHDVTNRKVLKAKYQKTTDTLKFLAHYSGIKSENNFFTSLAQFIASALDADFVCIDSLEGDGLNARTLAVWHDGKFEDNVVYALKDTPCGTLVDKQVCCFPASVTKLFPNDPVLQELNAESYVGVTLFDHTGQPIGLIAVIKKHPLLDVDDAEDLLKLVSIRASGELERTLVEDELKKSEEKIQKYLRILGGG